MIIAAAIGALKKNFVWDADGFSRCLSYADVQRALQPLRVRPLHLGDLDAICYTRIIFFAKKVTSKRQFGVHGAHRVSYTSVLFLRSLVFPAVGMNMQG